MLFRSQSHACYDRILERIRERWPDAATHCTICDATEDRQRETVKIAREADVMVVVGGYNSANTVRLAELAAETGTPTHHIESPEELKKEWFRGANTVGLSAGASTPPGLIGEVEETIRGIFGDGRNHAGKKFDWDGDTDSDSDSDSE